MTIEIGTAAGHYDLLAKINTFVTATLPIAERWVIQRSTLTGTGQEVLWKAPGMSGGEEIYLNLGTYESIPSDYYNFKINTATGYLNSNTFETQPGTCTTMGVPLWNNSIPYWMVGNGQRLIVIAKIENVYQSFSFGKYLPYATPSQYPYPVYCFGALPTASTTRYSEVTHVSGFKGTRANFKIRDAAGVWTQPDVYPYASSTQLRNTISSSNTAEGYYGIHSLVLSTSTPNVFGELQGLYYISGFNNAAENVITTGGKSYAVLRDVWRTGFNDYCILELS